MFRSTTLLIASALLSLCLSGCFVGGKVATTTVVANGDSVTNQNGTATGKVAGIALEVRGLKNGSASVTHGVGIVEGAGGSKENHKWEMKLGEVSLVFERGPDGPVSLNIDGKDFGVVESGSRLLIDENREVFVNDERRAATE